MLSIIARSNPFQYTLKSNRQLLDLTTNKLNNLTRPNLINFNGNQIKYFKTQNNRSGIMRRRSNQLSNEFIKSKLIESPVLRATVSAIGGSLLFFGAATIWKYENILKVRKYSLFSYQHGSRSSLKKWWNSLKDNQKVCLILGILNLAVFAAWRLPNVSQSFMYKYFTVNLASKQTFLPMLLSTFSHQTFPHLFLNMYCLYSFSGISTYQWGKESMIALYLSSGMFGSLASILLKVYRGSTSVSLGASAAILGIVSSIAISNPDLRFSIVFMPFSFPAQNALLGILALDTAGILLGWKLFDHAGHLGGTLFGIWYTYNGHLVLRKYQKKVAHSWHKFRKVKNK